MGEAIHISLTDDQLAEFLSLDAQEAEARKQLDAIPIAREYAARAIILGHYPLVMFAGRKIGIDSAQRALVFDLNETMPVLVPDTAQEAVS